ncbi:MAG: Hint domain-containing protein [Spirosomataceae bacterium]
MRLLFIIICAACSCARAQNNQRGISLEEYTKVKSVVLKNIEKKTYIQEQGFVFDRPDEKPFSFNLNDGIERKIYLYQIREATGAKNIGSLAVFTMQGKQINVAIPNKAASDAVWLQYINDLKNGNKAADGLAIGIAFMLSQGVNVAPPDSSTQETGEDNDFCFPAETFINMADGSEKHIALLKVGDLLAGFPNGKVIRVDKHEGTFRLTRILVRPNGQAWVSTHLQDGLMTLEATPNHPVLTFRGKKTIGQLVKGDWLFVRDAVTGRCLTAEITTIEPNARTVSQVFNLTTECGTYEAESIIVSDKN